MVITLKHVRSVVSKDIAIQVFRTTDRSEKMRDDEGLKAAAEAKRARKAAARIKAAVGG